MSRLSTYIIDSLAATYTVTVTANNGSTQTVTVSDLFPNNFYTTGVVPPFGAITLAPQGTQTFVVQGYFTQPNGCDSTWNVATLTNGGSVNISASVCVEVNIPCFVNGIETLEDSTKTSALTNTSFVTFYVDGTLIIDQTTTFYNCHIYVKAGGQIIVNTNMNLKLDNTIIEGCGFMWQGIKLQNGAHCEVLNDSWIRDADIGINIINNSRLRIFQSRITDCVVGVHFEPTPGCADISNTLLYVDESQFDMFRPAFLLSYNGQSGHGTKPKAGFELNNVLAQNILIGKLPGYAPNQFKNMNAGIVINNSTLDIYNTIFRTIQPENFYNEPWNGSAAVSVSSDSCSTTNLKVKTIIGIDNIKDCYRGIYTDYSGLEAVGVKILNTYEGVYSTRCPFPRSANVSGCAITASKYGINWEMNVGAMSMLAANNNITVHGHKYGACVRIAEAGNFLNCLVNDNDLFAVEILNGIVCSGVKKPRMTYNRIHQNTLGVNSPTSEGITLSGCDGAFVSCNNVYTNHANTTGIKVDVSVNSTITCNNTNNQTTGFFYGGSCGGTNMAGNSMINNDEGLHLNNAAVIGTQKHNGNQWLNYQSPFGAVNENYGFEGFSKFEVHTTMGTTYFPFLNFLNLTGAWFAFSPNGSPFSCNNSQTCIAAITNDEPQDLEKAIANDSASTVVYTAEAKSMNELYLFEKLATDSAFKASKLAYQQFYNANANTTIGKMYEVEKDMRNAFTFTPQQIYLLALADSLIKSKTDSIVLIDSLNSNNAISNYVYIRSELLNGISTLQSTIHNIVLIHKVNAEAIRNAVEVKNTMLVPIELPELNAKTINEINLQFESDGRLAVLNNYTQLFSIANQCPYAGGQAVYIARNLLSLLNDSIEYFDDAVCLQMGIFRMGKYNELLRTGISIVPNPAKNLVTIKVLNSVSGLCKISIIDALGKVQMRTKLDCLENTKTIDVSQLSNGIYTIKVQTDVISIEEKLIILK